MSDDLKIKRQRSPNFPAEPLEKCIDVAKRLYDKYKRSTVAQVVAIQGLGFSPTSGGALQLFAALSAYGLLEANGSGKARTVKLSDRAFKIILDTRPYSPERDELIKEAALSPPIFKMIKEENPDHLPAEDALSHDLKLRHDFNPNAVPGFIRVLTNTFEFAKTYESDMTPDETSVYQRQEPVGERDNIMANAPTTGPATVPTRAFAQVRTDAVLVNTDFEREIAKYPVGRDVSIRLIASGPVTQKSIEKLIKMLQINVEDFPANEETPNPPETKGH